MGLVKYSFALIKTQTCHFHFNQLTISQSQTSWLVTLYKSSVVYSDIKPSLLLSLEPTKLSETELLFLFFAFYFSKQRTKKTSNLREQKVKCVDTYLQLWSELLTFRQSQKLMIWKRRGRSTIKSNDELRKPKRGRKWKWKFHMAKFQVLGFRLPRYCCIFFPLSHFECFWWSWADPN